MKPKTITELIERMKQDAVLFHALVFHPKQVKEDLSELPGELQQSLLNSNSQKLSAQAINHLLGPMNCQATCKVTCSTTTPDRTECDVTCAESVRFDLYVNQPFFY